MNKKWKVTKNNLEQNKDNFDLDKEGRKEATNQARNALSIKLKDKKNFRLALSLHYDVGITSEQTKCQGLTSAVLELKYNLVLNNHFKVCKINLQMNKCIDAKKN